MATGPRAWQRTLPTSQEGHEMGERDCYPDPWPSPTCPAVHRAAVPTGPQLWPFPVSLSQIPLGPEMEQALTRTAGSAGPAGSSLAQTLTGEAHEPPVCPSVAEDGVREVTSSRSQADLGGDLDTSRCPSSTHPTYSDHQPSRPHLSLVPITGRSLVANTKPSPAARPACWCGARGQQNQGGNQGLLCTVHGCHVGAPVTRVHQHGQHVGVPASVCAPVCTCAQTHKPLS